LYREKGLVESFTSEGGKIEIAWEQKGSGSSIGAEGERLKGGVKKERIKKECLSCDQSPPENHRPARKKRKKIFLVGIQRETRRGRLRRVETSWEGMKHWWREAKEKNQEGVSIR